MAELKQKDQIVDLLSLDLEDAKTFFKENIKSMSNKSSEDCLDLMRFINQYYSYTNIPIEYYHAMYEYLKKARKYIDKACDLQYEMKGKSYD